MEEKWKYFLQAVGNETKVVETFETESTHPIELQIGGWQGILDSFKKYTETRLEED